MIKTILALAVAAIASASFAQTAPFNPPPPPGSYVAPASQAPDIYAQAISRTGTVQAVNAIYAQQQGASGSGAAIGAIVGGLAARGISSGGNSSRNRATIGGAILGGLLGNQVERGTGGEAKVTGYQIQVRFDDGSARTITHPSALPVGSRVMLDNGVLRVQTAGAEAPSADAPSYSRRRGSSGSNAYSASPQAVPGRAAGMEA